MDKPSKDAIEALKGKHPHRSLHLVTLKRTGESESFYFVMVGPDSDEYKKFNDDGIKARENAKSDLDRAERYSHVIETAVLRQVAWPDREEVKKLLHENPGFVSLLAEKIHEHAGSTAEVLSEKL